MLRFLQGSLDLQSPSSGDLHVPSDLITARHASPSKHPTPAPTKAGRTPAQGSAATWQQSDLTLQPSGSQPPLTPLETPPVHQGPADPAQHSSSNKSKLANLMQRFGQLKKSDKKADAVPADRGEEEWSRVQAPQMLTLGDDDDDVVCMQSPSVSPLPRR